MVGDYWRGKEAKLYPSKVGPVALYKTIPATFLDSKGTSVKETFGNVCARWFEEECYGKG